MLTKVSRCKNRLLGGWSATLTLGLLQDRPSTVHMGERSALIYDGPRGQCSNTARSSIRSRPIGASLRGPLAQVFCRGTRPRTPPATRRQSCFSSNDAAHHLRRRSERWDLGRFPGSRLTFACGWLQPITSSGLHRRLVCWRGLPPPRSRQEAACEGGGLGTQSQVPRNGFRCHYRQ